MRVAVKAFGGVAWAIGRRELHVELDKHATVADLLAAIEQEHAGLRRFIPSGVETLADALMVIVGRDEVSGDRRLADGEEVILIVPASGG